MIGLHKKKKKSRKNTKREFNNKAEVSEEITKKEREEGENGW